MGHGPVFYILSLDNVGQVAAYPSFDEGDTVYLKGGGFYSFLPTTTPVPSGALSFPGPGGNFVGLYGDLGGVLPSAKVTGFLGYPLQDVVPNDGDSFVFNAAPAPPGTPPRWDIAPLSSSGGPPTGPAGGSLAGLYPNPTLSVVMTPGTYGSATEVPVATVNDEGRVTAIVNTPIAYPAVLPPKLGNTAVVDAVNGNDTTGAVNGSPFLTVEAAVAAVAAHGAPATVWILPGSYELSAGITIPVGCGIRGIDQNTVVLQMTNLAAATTLLTMGENSIIEDVVLRMTSSNAAATPLIAVEFPGHTAQTSKVRACRIDIDNSAVPTGSTTNVYGIHCSGADAYADDLSAYIGLRRGVMHILSNGGGNKRGILLSTGAKLSIADAVVYVAPPVDPLSTGSYVAAETADNNARLQIRTSEIQGAPDAGSYTGSDILQTLPAAGGIGPGLEGIQVAPGVNLGTMTAGGRPFTTHSNMKQHLYALNGNVSSGTRYYWPGTITTADLTESFCRALQDALIYGLYVNLRTAPGIGNSVTITLRRKVGAGPSVATPFSVTISDNETSAEVFTFSARMDAGDYFSVESSSATGAGSAADMTVEIACF